MLSLLLLYTFHATLILGIFILIQFSANFNYCIRVLLALCLIQAATIVFQIGTPVGLLYSPLLYLAGQASRGRPNKAKSSLHFIPFFIFTFIYSILFWGTSTAAGWSNWLFSRYYPAYFLCMALSLMIYPLVILFQKEDGTQVDPLEEAILIQFSSLQLILAALTAVIFVKFYLKFLNVIFVYPPEFLTYFILFITIIIAIRYLYHAKGKKTGADTGSNKLPSAASGENLAGYAENIQQFLAETRMYLRPNLSLEMLSQETGIPKTVCSEVLNAHIGKSFYQLTAEYRIKYAVDLLNGDSQNYTIEALAYECGFNSKTSFNRYFKEYTGFKPSEYRSRKFI